MRGVRANAALEDQWQFFVLLFADQHFRPGLYVGDLVVVERCFVDAVAHLHDHPHLLIGARAAFAFLGQRNSVRAKSQCAVVDRLCKLDKLCFVESTRHKAFAVDLDFRQFKRAR